MKATAERRLPMLAGVLALLAALLATPAPASDRRTDLPRQVRQGDLVIGTTAPGARVHYAGRELRVDGHGRFVFGVGRDESGPLRLDITWPDGAVETVSLRVLAREWKIERVDGVPQQTVTPDPEIAARIAREQADVAAARERDDPRSDFATGFRWPVTGRVSGVYGSQRIYNGTPRSPHSGLDVAAPAGTPVRAPAPGIVTFARPDLYLTGGTVLIDHGHGVSSNFLHLSRLDVKVGDRVEAGQVIGAVGATGRATGPHMHWGVNWFDVRVDPQTLVDPGENRPAR
ncbi:M23 family metallopeptidase [Arenimonas fontis]|uniref:M23 family metallopeptidase n=1 Tax=Arenimonas fontis TaxID=2608255 RepID=A0A5B2ZE65_9GAMM|nr:M23 family metallopeptidase [Arenimonas fontis]KAA2285490.1 M23 family metallopeptidase [Arenimonas fontis]